MTFRSSAISRRLQRWLRGKPKGQPVWPGRWYQEAAEMLRRDLVTAGIEYKTEEGYFDFHATRHGAITNGSREMPLHQLMKFARHTKIETTIRYTHTSEEEMHEVAAALTSPDQARPKKHPLATSNSPENSSDQKSDHAAFAAIQRLSSDGIECPCCQNRISPDFVRAYAMLDTGCHQRARDGARTRNHRIDSPVLYPIELRARIFRAE